MKKIVIVILFLDKKKIVIIILFMDEKNCHSHLVHGWKKEGIFIVIITMIGYGPGTQWEDIGYTE